MTLPVKNQPYVFYTSLVDARGQGEFLEDPPIEAGDFTVSQDGSAYVNLATLPITDPPGSISVKVSLSASEMNGEKVTMRANDQNGNDWQEMIGTLDVPTASTETLFNIEEGDRTESNVRLTIKQKTTEIILIDKEITGSLLDNEITLRTTEPE